MKDRKGFFRYLLGFFLSMIAISTLVMATLMVQETNNPLADYFSSIIVVVSIIMGILTRATLND